MKSWSVMYRVAGRGDGGNRRATRPGPPSTLPTGVTIPRTRARMSRAAIHARISTGEQTPENQLRPRREVSDRAGRTVSVEYVQRASGPPPSARGEADARRCRPQEVRQAIVLARFAFGPVPARPRGHIRDVARPENRPRDPSGWASPRSANKPIKHRGQFRGAGHCYVQAHLNSQSPRRAAHLHALSSNTSKWPPFIPPDDSL